MDFTEIVCNKKDDEFSSEEQVSTNLLNAIDQLHKFNLGKEKELLDVEKCVKSYIMYRTNRRTC